MTMDFKTGDRVVNKAKPAWGPGKVLHAEGGIALVRFDSGAVRKLAVQFLSSCPPAGSEAAPGAKPAPHGTRENSKGTAEGGGRPAEESGEGLIERALAMLKSMEDNGRGGR